MVRRTSALVLLLILVGALPAAAQSWAVDRGSMRIGGSIGFTSSGSSVNGEDQDDRLTQITVAPHLEFFVVPGLALGGELIFSRLSAGDDDLTTYGLGPAATFFFGASEPRSVWPFVGGSLQFLWTAEQDVEDDPVTRAYRGEAGALFMLSRAVGLETAFFYQMTERETNFADLESDTFGIVVGVSAFVL